MKTVVKWAGNKTRIVNRIKDMLPSGRRLIEPFAGSAAVFLNTAYDHNLVNDVNGDLINLYRVIQTSGPDFVDVCKSFFVPENNTADAYYRLREEFNETEDHFRKAALFLYLNRHGYNGLVRYNADGGYNVPFGRYKKPYFPFDELKLFHEKAQTAEFTSRDFEAVMHQAEPGDVIYCDPPYVPLSATANFTHYSAGGFHLEDQVRLVRLAEEISARGVPVLISNHQSPFTDEVYVGADAVDRFEVQRFISCDGENRAKAPELLALYGGMHRVR